MGDVGMGRSGCCCKVLVPYMISCNGVSVLHSHSPATISLDDERPVDVTTNSLHLGRVSIVLRVRPQTYYSISTSSTSSHRSSTLSLHIGRSSPS